MLMIILVLKKDIERLQNSARNRTWRVKRFLRFFIKKFVKIHNYEIIFIRNFMKIMIYYVNIRIF